MNGAQQAVTAKEKPEIEQIETNLHKGNMQLESILSRLTNIRDGLYGSRPQAGADAKLNEVPSGHVPAIRGHIARGENLRQQINEALAEIESFV